MSERAAPQTDAAAATRVSLRALHTASVLLLVMALCVVSALKTDTFFTWRNLVDNLCTNAAYVGIVACGMTFVMIAGGFDLSVASITALCSVITVLTLRACAGSGLWVAIPLALMATLAAGTVLGAANGLLVAYAGVNPFVTTLSTMLIFRGIALVITHGGQTIMVPSALNQVFRALYWGRVGILGTAAHRLTVPIALFVVVFVALHVVLRYSRYGHYVYAVGGNETASWLAGINTRLTKTGTYVLCGMTCGVAAIVYTAMSSTAQAASCQGLEMIVIASVIVGGTPLGGGSGSLWCTLNGLALLSVIENLLSQFGIQEEYRNIVRGAIILIVVTVDIGVRRRSARYSR